MGMFQPALVPVATQNFPQAAHARPAPQQGPTGFQAGQRCFSNGFAPLALERAQLAPAASRVQALPVQLAQQKLPAAPHTLVTPAGKLLGFPEQGSRVEQLKFCIQALLESKERARSSAP